MVKNIIFRSVALNSYAIIEHIYIPDIYKALKTFLQLFLKQSFALVSNFYCWRRL